MESFSVETLRLVMDPLFCISLSQMNVALTVLIVLFRGYIENVGGLPIEIFSTG